MAVQDAFWASIVMPGQVRWPMADWSGPAVTDESQWHQRRQHNSCITTKEALDIC